MSKPGKSSSPKSANGERKPTDRIRIAIGNASRTLVGVRRQWEADAFDDGGRMVVSKESGERMGRVLDVVTDAVKDLRSKVIEYSVVRK
jgi:hypothetical protein